MKAQLYLGLTVGATGLVALSIALWAHAGERIYVDRLLSAIASCFG